VVRLGIRASAAVTRRRSGSRPVNMSARARDATCFKTPSRARPAVTLKAVAQVASMSVRVASRVQYQAGEPAPTHATNAKHKTTRARDRRRWCCYERRSRSAMELRPFVSAKHTA
jgi:hypothetical protein